MQDSSNADIAEAGKYLIIYPPSQPLGDAGIGTLAYVESCTFHEDKKRRKKAPKYFVLSVILLSRVRVIEGKKIEVPGKGFAWEGIWEPTEEELISEEKWGTEEFKLHLGTLKSRLYELRMIMTRIFSGFAPVINMDYFLGLGITLEDEFAKTARDIYGTLLDSICLYFLDFIKMLNNGNIPSEVAVDVKNIFIELNHKDRMEKLLQVLEYFTSDWQNILQNGLYDRRGYEARMEMQSDGDKADEDDDLSIRYYEIKDSMPPNVRKIIERGFRQIREDEQTQGIAEDILKKRLEWLVGMPWGFFTTDTENLDDVKKILNDDHFGLEKVKQLIYEHLAVRKLNPLGKSPILCLVGPPGVGKTSLGQSIARALGRKFVRISLGGLHDEAEIRGHRSTYMGAFPGKIIEGIRDAGSMNPVFMLDEIEKVGSDWKGDPKSALLEALDPEQNHSFKDNYLRISFDLSRVFFITTANTTDTMLPALRDRMEVVELPGYIPQEKLQIAKRHLIPKQKKENGFPAIHAGKTFDLDFSNGAILKMIYERTDEAGVRNLERVLNSAFRKTADKIFSDDPPTTEIIEITEQNIHIYCGKAPFIDSALPQGPLPPGVVPVLCVSSSGTGHVIFVEVSIGYHPGGRKIVVYGVDASGEQDLGNEVKQSVKIAWDALTSRNCILFDTVREFEQKFGPMLVSVSLTDLGTLKSGPSAGVPIFLALFGALVEESIRPTSEIPLLAATGEITKKLDIISAVGNIREKILVAHRKGVRVAIIPKDNERDIEDITREILEGPDRIHIIPESSMFKALERAYPNNQLLQEYLAKNRK